MDKIKEWIKDPYVVKKIAIYVVIFAILSLLSLNLSYNLHMLITRQPTDFINLSVHLEGLKITKVWQFFMIFLALSLLFIFYLIFTQKHLNVRSGSRKIVPGVTIPEAAGNGQYGSARFNTIKEAKLNFQTIKLADISALNANDRFSQGGIYLGANHSQTECYSMSEDTHAIILGSSGSGKTRCIVLQTITTLALAGESMIISDPKSELYIYTKELLDKLGYNVVVLDFIQFNKSNQYNFLQPIIDAVNQDQIPLAITRANDLVASLVQSDRTNESIWTDGERSVIACAIMAVVYDNKQSPQYQTLTNVYYFLENMCKPNAFNQIPLSQYIRSLPDNHPAKSMVGVSEIAPEKMRGSFYTSALTTLQLFTSPDIYSTTCLTDFDLYTTARRKTAIFLILPDYKSTYYNIATLFVSQQYQIMRDYAYQHGGRMPIRLSFIMDEFGNFAKIPDFSKHITVGRGCGIRYMLFLQDFAQLRKIYGDDDAKIIRSNTDVCVYLKTADQETLKELCEKLGKYTIKSQSYSASSTGGSESYNFTGRELLMPSELELFNRPYQLVLYKGQKYVMYSPDISKTIFNELLGMGDKKYNLALFEHRNSTRIAREPPKEIAIWKIWEAQNYKKSKGE